VRKTLNIVRHMVQVLMLALFATPLIASAVGGLVPGAGPFFGTLLSSTVLQQLVLADPFAALQVLAASKSPLAPTLLSGATIVLAFYGLLRGRAFCGWVCPVNLLLESVDWVAARLGKKDAEKTVLDRHAKLLVAGCILALSALVGVPVFELFSPVGALSRTLATGATLGLWALAAIVVAEAFLPGRIWCRSLCPLGGFYELVGRLGLLRVKTKPGCSACGACRQVCLADPKILDPVIEGATSAVYAGDCMLCGKCTAKCPQGVLSIGIAAPLVAPVGHRRNINSKKTILFPE
jgi:ferredoxin-type protein NapH